MTVTSADVARHAGLSRATVSQVLNGHAHRFAVETAERVLKAAKELDYEPSTAGRMLRTGLSDFVIALVPNTTFGGNLQDIFDTVTEQLAKRGLTLVLRLSTQSPSSLDRILAGMKPRAVLSLQPFTDQEKSILAERGVPSFDTSTSGNLNYSIGRIQAEHLVAQGYQRIAFAHLRDNRLDPYGDDRENAVKDVCREAGLPAPMVFGLGVDAAEAGAALDLLKPGVGVACYNDDIAITLLNAANRRGWSVPADIGLVGMDNTPLSQVTNPRLTTIGYDLAAVAQLSVAAALAALGEGEVPAAADIELHLIAGDSA
ncbi:LacI family DNA-binding transcriptional regulator [Herbiconiux sp. VKM Ac-2851]|uniref:LacI family DNA-binding transcriptional regulator n=1 Tax=Herbiconiux sp. VKM Ac-2851 TaxID=2739025 RepID=UPI0015674678|nr:LacI family DNA-binding transcriptional regulator [Herbiconiux sp. VKM Ac-2851]NQX35709.1 LacI family DNA-binding transcriptional regulator [Herbiconiux sp. VKM Ac-2851]